MRAGFGGLGTGPADDLYYDHMSITLTATEAKAKILSLLDQVSEGEEIEITKRGRPVARLVPPRGARDLKGRFAGVVTVNADEEELFSTGAKWNVLEEGEAEGGDPS